MQKNVDGWHLWHRKLKMHTCGDNLDYQADCTRSIRKDSSGPRIFALHQLPGAEQQTPPIKDNQADLRVEEWKLNGKMCLSNFASLVDHSICLSGMKKHHEIVFGSNQR